MNKKNISFEDCIGYRVIPCYNVFKHGPDLTNMNNLMERESQLVASFLTEEEALNFKNDQLSENSSYYEIVKSVVIEIQLPFEYAETSSLPYPFNRSVFFNYSGKNKVLCKAYDTLLEKKIALSKLTPKEKKLLGLE